MPRDKRGGNESKRPRLPGLIRRLLITVSLSLVFILIGDCSGGRANLRLSELRYPVSLSGFLFGERGEILGKGSKLRVVRIFKYEKSYWNIGYSFLGFSDESAFDHYINKEIEIAGGDGVINLKVTSTGCLINSTPCLTFLPVWPGCTVVKIRGEIVKYGGHNQREKRYLSPVTWRRQ